MTIHVTWTGFLVTIGILAIIAIALYMGFAMFVLMLFSGKLSDLTWWDRRKQRRRNRTNERDTR